MAGKKFRFRSDGNRRVGIKEVVSRSMSVKGPRVSVSIGLDANLTPSTRHQITDNILVPFEGKIVKKGKGSKAIYYPLDSILYIATITFQFNKSKKVIDKTLTLYVPSGICSDDEIYCQRITSSITNEKRENIIKGISNYALSRV